MLRLYDSRTAVERLLAERVNVCCASDLTQPISIIEGNRTFVLAVFKRVETPKPRKGGKGTLTVVIKLRETKPPYLGARA